MSRSGKAMLVVVVIAMLLSGAWLLERRRVSSLDQSQSGPGSDSPPVVGRDSFGSSSTQRLSKPKPVAGSTKAFLLTDPGAILSGDALEVIAQLEPRAMNGDAEAAYAIFLKLSDCKSKLSGEHAGALPQYSNAGAAQGLLSELERAEQECGGLSDAAYHRSGDWLEKAAAGGSLAAQLYYAADPAQIVGSQADMLRQPDRVKDYKSKAMSYLSVASSNGSIDATLGLANAYWAGVLVDADPVRSYAYYYAVSSVDANLVPRRRMNDLAGGLSSQQLSDAISQGRKIYEQCCK